MAQEHRKRQKTRPALLGYSLHDRRRPKSGTSHTSALMVVSRLAVCHDTLKVSVVCRPSRKRRGRLASLTSTQAISLPLTLHPLPRTRALNDQLFGTRASKAPTLSGAMLSSLSTRGIVVIGTGRGHAVDVSLSSFAGGFTPFLIPEQENHFLSSFARLLAVFG